MTFYHFRTKLYKDSSNGQLKYFYLVYWKVYNFCVFKIVPDFIGVFRYSLIDCRYHPSKATVANLGPLNVSPMQHREYAVWSVGVFLSYRDFSLLADYCRRSISSRRTHHSLPLVLSHRDGLALRYLRTSRRRLFNDRQDYVVCVVI